MVRTMKSPDKTITLYMYQEDHWIKLKHHSVMKSCTRRMEIGLIKFSLIPKMIVSKEATS